MRAAAELWRGYAKLCLPPGASQDQAHETRRAFYAGMLAACLESSAIAKSGEVDDAVVHLDDFYKEIDNELAGMVIPPRRS